MTVHRWHLAGSPPCAVHEMGGKRVDGIRSAEPEEQPLAQATGATRSTSALSCGHSDQVRNTRSLTDPPNDKDGEGPETDGFPGLLARGGGRD